MDLANTLQPLTTAVTSAVSVGDIVTVLGIVVGAGMGFALTWFGARKLIGMLKSAIFKGKLSV